MIPIDFETASEAGYVWHGGKQKWVGPPGASGATKGLGVVGVANYARHPSTRVLCMGHGGCLWVSGTYSPPLSALLEYVRAGGLVAAWNAAFEWWIWNEVCVPRYGWPPLRMEQMRCTMARARAHSLPGKLGLVAEVLRLENQKDADGGRLLKLFSMPRNPTKANPRLWTLPADEPDEAARLYEYCRGDVAAETEAAKRIPALTRTELQFWLDDQAINRRGVQIDLPSVDACATVVDQCVEQYGAELQALAGCKPTELAQLRGWLAGRGVTTDSLDADAIDALLAVPQAPEVRRALELRQLVGSASVKKVYAMRNQATPEGRLHDLYNYHGARTGRCIAEGQVVLVLREDGTVAEVPIETVAASDLLWDGSEWVSHGGVVYSGEREVVTHDGLTATPDHPVFISTDEYTTLSDARSRGMPLFTGEVTCPRTSTPWWGRPENATLD